MHGAWVAAFLVCKARLDALIELLVGMLGYVSDVVAYLGCGFVYDAFCIEWHKYPLHATPFSFPCREKSRIMKVSDPSYEIRKSVSHSRSTRNHGLRQVFRFKYYCEKVPPSSLAHLAVPLHSKV